MPFSASNAYILVVAVKSWQYGMAPAYIPVFLSQKPSTENGINRPWQAILFFACSRRTSSNPPIGLKTPSDARW